MPRITIRQFRAVLAGGADAEPFARAYRELARHPARALAVLAAGWPVWEERSTSLPNA